MRTFVLILRRTRESRGLELKTGTRRAGFAARRIKQRGDAMRWEKFSTARYAMTLSAGILTAVPCSATRAADSSAEPSLTLEEVVVTATKRAESLQDVPLSITALSAQTLERAGILTFEDYAAKVPNLTFASGLGIMDARQVSLRGVQGVDTTGFYIDDLPIPATMDPRVIDLDRIEVLRGPQGTLYGARSMGGTVRMITQAPDLDSTSARVHALGSRVDGGGGVIRPMHP